MTTRIMARISTGASWATVADSLRRDAGALDVLAPTRELPDYVVAIFPGEVATEEIVNRVLRVPGVAAAEPDAWRTSMLM